MENMCIICGLIAMLLLVSGAHAGAVVINATQPDGKYPDIGNESPVNIVFIIPVTVELNLENSDHPDTFHDRGDVSGNQTPVLIPEYAKEKNDQEYPSTQADDNDRDERFRPGNRTRVNVTPSFHPVNSTTILSNRSVGQ